jgi:nicotinate-nucleotide pyrophosphorylase (carboxylating)
MIPEALAPASTRADADRVARTALDEDGPRDLTTGVTGAGESPTVGRIEYRSGGILAGREWAEAVARETGCSVRWTAADGDRIGAGEIIGTLEGSFAAVLRGERPLLNLLQRACGIANATAAYVVAVAGTGCRVLHTRKTAPGLRLLDIAAVLAGGGALHRLDLSHTVMIKDNHWQALAQSGVSLREALVRAREQGAASCQVEVESRAQVEAACAAGADRLLIDNQPPETVREWGAVARHLRTGIEIEATGGIDLSNVRSYAEAGADFVSIGALTHSVRAADLGVEIQKGTATT